MNIKCSNFFFFIRITSTPNVVNNSNNVNGNGSSSSNQINGINGNGITNGTESTSLTSFNYDKLKQELMGEFRKELQTIKADIINSQYYLRLHFCFFLLISEFLLFIYIFCFVFFFFIFFLIETLS
jgi:hypothetical protein